MKLQNLTWIIAAIISGCCWVAEATTVIDVKKKKKTATVDSGTADGFLIGKKVCISDAAGVAIGCGKVIEATEGEATLKLTAKLVKKVKKGMPAALDGVSAAGSAANRTNFKPFYLLTPVPPIQFNKLSYLAPETDAVATLWNPAEKSGISFLGGGAEFEFGVGSSMAIAIAGRYRAYRDFLAESDYDPADSEVYARSEMTATSVGGWFDFYFLQAGTAPFLFRMLAGLDVDMNTVNFKSTKKADVAEKEDVVLATATSNLNLVSLRLGLQLNFFFKPIGIAFGVTPIIPLSVFGAKSTVKIDDPNKSKVTGGITAEEDFTKSIAHQKATFGVETLVGLYFAF